jgi:hypothetical protein
LALDGVFRARPGDCIANALLFPFVITRLVPLRGKGLGFFIRNFVVGDQNTAPLAAIDGVKEIDSVKCSSRTRKIINN